jgi:hypothetical protein
MHYWSSQQHFFYGREVVSLTPKGTYLAQILGVCHFTVELHIVSLRNMLLCKAKYAVWTTAVNPNLNIAV